MRMASNQLLQQDGLLLAAAQIKLMLLSDDLQAILSILASPADKRMSTM